MSEKNLKKQEEITMSENKEYKGMDELLKRIAEDEAFRGKVRALNDLTPKRGIEALKELGYEITEEDWRAQTSAKQGGCDCGCESGELSTLKELCEEDLDTVTGGETRHNEKSRECWLMTGEWNGDKTRVRCLRWVCRRFNEDKSDDLNYYYVCCYHYGTETCVGSWHKLMLLDNNGKCEKQDGFNGSHRTDVNPC